MESPPRLPFLFSPSVMDSLCAKAENVERGNCEEFVFIMYAYRNDDKIMHEQCNAGGEMINLLNNVKQLGDAMIMFRQLFYIFAEPPHLYPQLSWKKKNPFPQKQAPLQNATLRNGANRQNDGAKMSVCLIIASYHNYLLFDFSMHVIRMFRSALERNVKGQMSVLIQLEHL